MGNKIPESVLVVIHTPDLQVLLLERADHPGFWQSVTGSKDRIDEPLEETCRREVLEETGIDAAAHCLVDWQLQNRYEIYPHWRARYPDGTTHNTELIATLQRMHMLFNTWTQSTLNRQVPHSITTKIRCNRSKQRTKRQAHWIQGLPLGMLTLRLSP